MFRSAVTVSLVPHARGGPFVFWDDLEAACRHAVELGFDAIEIFAPSPAAVDRNSLQALLDETGLHVAAVGTGAGMIVHGLSLTDPDRQRRQDATQFVQQMIDFGARFSAPAIIGSMQGRWQQQLDRAGALELLVEALEQLGKHAASCDVPLIYEPLNRYETNLINTLDDGVQLLKGVAADNVKLLADLFHMNIEEANLADAIRTAASSIGHVHFVDSNRRAAGMGHMDFEPIIAALSEIGYQGYLSAEAFPLPDPLTAAQKTIESYKEYCTV